MCSVQPCVTEYGILQCRSAKICLEEIAVGQVCGRYIGICQERAECSNPSKIQTVEPDPFGGREQSLCVVLLRWLAYDKVSSIR